MLAVLAQNLTTVNIERRIELARWSTGNMLVIGAIVATLVVYAVVRLYRRETRDRVSVGLRWSMVICRLGALLMLGCIAMEPRVVDYVHRRQDAVVLVLADGSASMSLPDLYRGEDAQRPRLATMENAATPAHPSNETEMKRTTLAEGVLNTHGGRFLDALAERNGVSVFAFDEDLSLLRSQRMRAEGVSDRETEADVASGAAVGPIRLTADGGVTDVGQAVRGAIDSAGGAPVAAVVLLTDGCFNVGEPPTQVAEYLARKGIPLHIIGIGDPTEPVNVSVVEVSAPRLVFRNDPFDVVVRMSVQATAQEDITLTLERRDITKGGPAEVLERRTVRASADGAVEPVRFSCKVDTAGTFAFAAVAEPIEAETILVDNRREAYPAVQVLDAEMRVLVVAGAPSYDYRFLTRLLERDAGVNVSTWLQSAEAGALRDGDTVIDHLPTEPADLFNYDAIILVDCNPTDVPDGWGEHLTRFVSDQGGGVLYAAGCKYAGVFFRSANVAPFVQILPIVPDENAEIILNDLGQYQTTSWPVLVPHNAASSPILRQSDDSADTPTVWAELEGVYWHYPVKRAKAIADVLMQHSNPRMTNASGPHVLLATQFVGAGRTAYLGFDSTWRWRRGDERRFDRFWIQMLRFLVEGRLSSGRSRGLISTGKERFSLGEAVPVTVRALTERFDPLLLPEMDLVATRCEPPTSSESVRLLPIPGREGYYQGTFVAERLGAVRLSLELPGLLGESGDSPADGGGSSANERKYDGHRIEKEILVVQPDIEMRNTAMKRPLLVSLAAQTGGRYFDVDDAEQVVSLIPDCSRTPPPSRGRARPLWDNAWWMALLVTLLTTEWILRKKARLL